MPDEVLDIQIDNLSNTVDKLRDHRVVEILVVNTVIVAVVVAVALVVVVDSYKNGTDWYRIWSDGWVEQGGRTTEIYWTKNGYSIQVLLPVAMTDTNYHVIASMSVSPISGWGAPGCRAYPGDKYSIWIGLAKPADATNELTAPCYWVVKGMYK